MRRRTVFIYGNISSGGGGGGGELQQTVQVNMGDGTWNTPQVSGWFRYCSNEGTSVSNVTNSDGTDTGWSIARPAIGSTSEGPTTTTVGYPADVTHYENTSSTSPANYVVSGLNDSYTYTFDFWGYTSRSWENDLGTSVWTIGGDSVSILHKNYDGLAVTISSVSPSSGSITIAVTIATSASQWFFASMIIKEYN